MTVFHPSHCHPINPWIICPGRAEARKRGAFFWDMKVGGYVCTDLPAREASWRAKFYNLDEHHGEPYRLEICPFCGMQLPELFDEGENHPIGQNDGEGYE